KRGLKTIVSDGCNIPLPDSSFDFAVSVASFQYVSKKSRRKFLSELKRVARFGVVLYTPVDSSLKTEEKLHSFRNSIHYPDPWLEMELKAGLPNLSIIKSEFLRAKIYGIQNREVWYKIMVLESIPVLNLFIPGIFYALFLRHYDRGNPIAYVVSWNKQRIVKK
ncbi:MAG: methyltransferase domain-containing protein, partial [Candidatus Woesearchaeota archaeon]|nr:methyltransferase domain-containing protein [Candidatus Woesearchaeota archaeon]